MFDTPGRSRVNMEVTCSNCWCLHHLAVPGNNWVSMVLNHKTTQTAKKSGLTVERSFVYLVCSLAEALPVFSADGPSRHRESDEADVASMCRRERSQNKTGPVPVVFTV